MNQFKRLLSAISIIFVFVFFSQVSHANQIDEGTQSFAAQRSHTQDGSDTVTITNPGNRTIKFTYRNDLLVSKTVGTREVSYFYNADRLLTYATTNNGTTYNTIRDRAGRIVSISGVNNYTFEVAYKGDSIIPSSITVNFANGQNFYPSFLTSQENIDRAATLNIQKIDQRLALIYENSTLSEVELSELGAIYNNGDPGNNSRAGTRAVVINTTCQGCYTIYLMDIDCCNRNYPGSSPVQVRNRQMCYEGAMQYYADCLRDCT